MSNQIVPEVLLHIRNLHGMEELKQLIEEWYIIAQNLEKLPKHPRMILPNCLLAAQSGTGLTRLLGMIVQFLEKTKLVEFIGDPKYFEFVLDRSENPERFPSLTRLIDNFRNAAGFREIFKGVVCIDISEWIEDLHDIRFLRFLEYASDFDHNIIFMFIIPLLDEQTIEKVESVLASFLRIRCLKLDFPGNDVLFNYVIERLLESGFNLKPGTEKILAQTIARVRTLQSFDGYNTLNQLVTEMIYEKCSHSILQDYLLTEKDLHLFLPDGPWIRQLAGNKRKPSKIGFERTLKGGF